MNNKTLALALVIAMGAIVFIQQNATNQTGSNQTTSKIPIYPNDAQARDNDKCQSQRGDNVAALGCDNAGANGEEQNAFDKKECRETGNKCSSSQTGFGTFGNTIKEDHPSGCTNPDCANKNKPNLHRFD